MILANILRKYWSRALLVAGAGILGAIVMISLPSTTMLQANPTQPCSDLDGDGEVTQTDLDILMSYFGQLVPPAPEEADVNVSGLIDLGDMVQVTGDIGTFTNCQSKPITFKGDPRLNITMLSATAPQAVPGACFDISDAAQPQTTLFTVCDNNFQGSPELDPLCTPDGVCDDEKTGDGLIRVELAPGDYSVAETKAPMNHTPDPNKKSCSAVPGAKCGVTFLNEVIDAPSPWFPWDTNGDNSVSGLDFFEVLAHFNEEKP